MDILTVHEILLPALATVMQLAAVSVVFTADRGWKRARLATHAVDLLRRYLYLAREVRDPIAGKRRYPPASLVRSVGRVRAGPNRHLTPP
jgi:hypothetical protein